VLEHILHELTIKVKAKDIPSNVSLNVAALDIGDALHISDLALPEGMSTDMDQGLVIATVVPPTVAAVEEEEEDLLEGEEALEGEDEEDKDSDSDTSESREK